MTRRAAGILCVLLVLLAAGLGPAWGAPAESSLELTVSDSAGGLGSSSAVRIVILLSLLTLAPALLLLMTSFVRLIIAFHFIRQALGTPQVPPNQVIIALALFMTMFIMSPVIDQVYEQAWVPFEQGELDTIEAIKAGADPFKGFMLQNTRETDLKLFLKMSRSEQPESPEDLSMRVLVPAFAISELRTGFEIGFLLFLPFLIVDLVVASVLLSMGMMMLPPAMISLPFKVMLFVLVDGWNLLAGSLVAGFS
jgi:flagellar biosynthetic protein FliP